MEFLYRYRFGSVEFDEARFELRVGGLVVDLERKPLLVLVELLRRADEVVKREELRAAVWAGRPGVEHGLSNTILKLRRALGPEGERIRTVSKGGYRFVGTVERVAVGRISSGKLGLHPGERVPGRGDFVLERLLGESAANEVWLARRPADDTARVFKFSRQNEFLALLKRETTVHRLLTDSFGPREDFVPVKSWNFSAPPYFIENEYCGQNLAEWSIEQDRLRRLSLAERLAIFLQVADALAAAHSVGVLHKDLKPANIFVMTNGATLRVRVGDFGNAALLEPGRLDELGLTRSGLTQPTGQADKGLSGTPFYLAPELISGMPATIQTDVYALGLILFQLVVGDLRRPMASGWESEVGNTLLCEDISFATIGDPSRRLFSVPALTTRLRDLDVREAARLGAIEKKREAELLAQERERTRARRPWIIASIAALVLGIAVALVMYQKEREARRSAEIEQRRSEATNQFLTSMLQRADPTAPGGEANTTIQSAITHASQALERSFPNDSVIKGSIELTLGNTLWGLSQFDKALEFQRAALASLTAGLGPGHSATLEASYHVAGTLDMLSRHQEAREWLDRTDAAAGSRLGETSRLSFLAHSVRGGNFLLQMQAAPALREFELTEAIRRLVDPSNGAWLIHVRSDIAWCDVRLGRDADAIRALAELITPAYRPETIGMLEWMKLHLQYGMALANVGRAQESESVLVEAEHKAETNLGKTHYLVGLAWSYLAQSYKSAGRWPAAAEAAQREYQVWLPTIGGSHQSTLSALADVTTIDYLRQPDQKNFDRLRDVYATLDQQLGPRNPFTQYMGFFYASALLDHGHPLDASRLAGALDPQSIASADPSPYWEPRVEGLKGRVMLAQDRREDASRLLQSAASTLATRGAPEWITAPVTAALRQSATL